MFGNHNLFVYLPIIAFARDGCCLRVVEQQRVVTYIFKSYQINLLARNLVVN